MTRMEYAATVPHAQGLLATIAGIPRTLQRTKVLGWILMAVAIGGAAFERNRF
ncbi:MAG TPA: hypothetical protein QF761_12070 [Pirellulales bacterium]|nr:hypothetical protein [Pirellulales bacterium]